MEPNLPPPLTLVLATPLPTPGAYPTLVADSLGQTTSLPTPGAYTITIADSLALETSLPSPGA
jgi:hypothetical protein